MRMREILGLSEAVTTEKNHFGGSFQLHHNPSEDEFFRLFDDAHYVVRAVIGPDGDLFCCDGEKAIHHDIDQAAGTSGYMAFTIYNSHIDSLDADKRALRAALKNNAVMVSTRVAKLRMTSERRGRRT